MASQSIASDFAKAVIQRPELQHGAVRLGLWLAAVAEQQGGFPVRAHYTSFRSGLHTELVDAPGVNFRPKTVKESITALEEAGLLVAEADPSYPRESKRAPKLFTLTVASDD